MLQIGGIVFLFAMVFGGFLISGGSLGVIAEALPHEMMTIGGAAIAALLIGGSMYLVGMLMMAFNLARTALAGKAVDGETTVVVERVEATEPPWAEILFGTPVFEEERTFSVVDEGVRHG